MIRLANLRSTLTGDAEIANLSDDSRRVLPGALFVCRPSKSRDTHELLVEAAGKGASAALVHSQRGLEEANEVGLAALLVEAKPEGEGETLEEQTREASGEFSEAVWKLCRAFYGDPGRQAKLFGVTGTNGKTTVAWMIHELLEKGAYMGTLGLETPRGSQELANTTPFAPEAYRCLHGAIAEGAEAVALEISSHALAERRVDGLSLEVAAFTNLSRDHLDYHGDMARYSRAKARLFHDFEVKHRVFNVDDAFGAELADQFEDAWRVSFRPGALSSRLIRAVPKQIGIDQVEIDVNGIPIAAPFGGAYHAENLGVALASALAAGADPWDLARRALAMRPTPGRFEPVPNERGLAILVDYAHTPDGLEKLLKAARACALAGAKLHLVFGCGGDRDRGKRPVMGRIAAELADRVIVTSDNPRTEDPAQIIADILEGMRGSPATVLDRREAVSVAVKGAVAGDVVLIAGKGHENYQIIGSAKHAMDDRDLVREALT